MKLKLDGYIFGPMCIILFFKKKILVALESRTLIWVPLLQAMTLKELKMIFQASDVSILQLQHKRLYWNIKTLHKTRV